MSWDAMIANELATEPKHTLDQACPWCVGVCVLRPTE